MDYTNNTKNLSFLAGLDDDTNEAIQKKKDEDKHIGDQDPTQQNSDGSKSILPLLMLDQRMIKPLKVKN